ncbi:hypothetical protein [Paenibacillus amylolyticus]|uniref:Uncharacterized protein n=1 Tax=Paenibacillus amylolyticus TaxID=1451 RepID=A0A117I155_PAEAM|nr:hypothetical protein [Paenibacillus amylolyticus]GAS81645.1 unknown protein [Paenibacillus amylolyticus]
MSKRNIRIVLIAAMVILLSLLSVFTYMYMNERAGGLADRRISKVWGLNEPIRIPIANSPEGAVQEFRGEFYNPDFIHQEAVDGGMILFTHKKSRENSSNLQMEYVRKNIFGWKWVWGGGYSVSEATEGEFALDYMSIPTLDQVSTPFPMLFGNIQDSSIKRISVETQENETIIATDAKLVEVSHGHLIWYVFLPPSAAIPYVIKGFNEEGKLITNKQIKDANDSGSLTLRK